MKKFLPFLLVLIVAFTGCKKDDEKPMTDKQFDKMVKRYFADKWMPDVVNHEHKTLNEKSHALKGKIEAVFCFNADGSYQLTYDSSVNNSNRGVIEIGRWLIDNPTRTLKMFPVTATMKDAYNYDLDLPSRANYQFSIILLDSEHLNLSNHFTTTVTVINSEGIPV